MVPAPGIPWPAPVVLRGVRLRVDDGALLAQLRDERVIARRKIDVVSGIGSARGPQVLHFIGILEGEGNAVHGERLEIGISTVLLVQFGSALQCIRLPAELLTYGWRALRQRAGRRMPI